MEIRYSSDVPDDNYFLGHDVEPIVGKQVTVLYNGNGKGGKWGRPGVTSTAVVQEKNFLAIHIGYHHKYGGGQFWRYYNINGLGIATQVTWRSLSDEMREMVLEGWESRAPAWSRCPGKLRSAYVSPKQNKFTAFKIVEVLDDGSFESLHDHTRYTVGHTMTQRALRHHNGGYYVYLGNDVKERFLAGEIIHPYPGKFAILECECWGNTVRYDSSGNCIDDAWYCDDMNAYKIAVTYCKPVAVREEFRVMLEDVGSWS